LAVAFFGLAPDTVQPNVQANPARSARISAPAAADQELSQIIATLDTGLAAPQDASRWVSKAKTTLWNFTRKVQARSLRPDQEALVLRHLDDVGRTYPAAGAAVAQARRIVTTLTVGKVAPEIVGHDLDGQPMRLSDYRGRVVVLAFSGHWCGICRSDYPFERQLLERHGSSAFALVGVNSDADRAVARKAYQDNGLAFRSFWDGARGGPIATAWEVIGWPTTYVLDGEGVIRFVDLRQEPLLSGVAELIDEAAGAKAR
jgi:peroxiredoxin